MTQTLDLDIDAFRIPAGRDAAAAGAAAAHGGRLRYWVVAAATLALALVPALVWPGDVQFVNDEPKLLGRAFLYNEAGKLADRGLAGNLAIEYGPVATQAYQAILLVTTDPPTVVRVHAVLMAGVTAVALLWLGRSTGLTPAFAAVVVATPFVCWSNRVLWDATIAVPLGALAIAAYAAWLRGRSPMSLGLAVFCGALVPLCHLQGTPLAVALFGHLAVRAWRCRRRPGRPIDPLTPARPRGSAFATIVALAAVLALNAGYARVVAYTIKTQLTGKEPAKPMLAGHGLAPIGRVPAAAGAMLGGSVLATRTPIADWLAARPDTPEIKSWRDAAELVSYAAIPLTWMGIVAAAVRVVRGQRSATGRPMPPSPAQAARRSVYAIALVALAVQAAMFFAGRIPPWPWYFYGTFPLHVVLAWAGFESLKRAWLRKPFLVVWGAAALLLTASDLWRAHLSGLPRGVGPSLAGQVDVARQLNRYGGEAEVWTDVGLFVEHPETIRTLRLMCPAAGEPMPAGAKVLIRYKSTGRASDVEVVELAAGEVVPAEARRIDAAPIAR